MFAAVLASLLAMHLAVTKDSTSGVRLTLGSLLVGSGICAMHYIGMSAVHFSEPVMWSVSWVTTSCAIALLASFAALLLLNRSERDDFKIGHQVSGALAIGLAICGMHYSAMHAMMLHAGSVAVRYPSDTTGATLARLGVGNALIFTFCLLVISHYDRLRLLRIAHDAQLRAQSATRKAEQLSTAGRIAASIAHEVNNPLEAVTNLLYLAEINETNPDALSYVRLAQTQLQRVSEITTHTLKFYRQQHAASWASLPELADSVLVLFSGKLEKQHITVQKEWPSTLPEVYCRAGEIRQVIANLVGNAIDSMPHGGDLSLTAQITGDRVELAVLDTGMGIPQEVREKLFEPFFTTKGLGGTGLGLSISAEIVERHGGTLTYESNTQSPNQGTTFRMLIPRRMQRDELPIE